MAVGVVMGCDVVAVVGCEVEVAGCGVMVRWEHLMNV